MSIPKSEVPPPKSLQATLRKITETLAQELADPQGDWTRLSQSRRILRWISSRPARPVTMHAD